MTATSPRLIRVLVVAATDDDVWITAVGSGDATLWLFGEEAGPTPYLSQLRRLDDLWIEIDEVAYRLEMVPRVGGAADHVEVSYSPGR